MSVDRKRTQMIKDAVRQWLFPVVLLSFIVGIFTPSLAYINNYALYSVKYYQLLPRMLLEFVGVLALGVGLALLICHWQWVKSKLGDYIYLAFGILIALTFVAFVQNKYPSVALLVWGVFAGMLLRKWEHKYVYLIYGIAIAVGLAVFVQNKYPLVTLFLWGTIAGFAIKEGLRPIDIFTDVVFGLSLAICVQLLFANDGLEVLSNNQPSWNNQAVGAILSLHLWGLCLILPSVLRLIDRPMFRRIRFFGSIALTAVLVIGLAVRLLTVNLPPIKVVTKDDEFTLSTEDNVVVFMVDSLDAQYVEDYILAEDMRLEVPEEETDDVEELFELFGEDQAEELVAECDVEALEEEAEEEIYVLDAAISHGLLDDFTYFDNVVSGGAPSNLSIPSMLTGKAYTLDYESMTDYYEEAYASSTLFRDLKQYGYDVRIYSYLGTLEYADDAEISNIRTDIDFREKSFGTSMKNLSRLTGYYALPYQMKKTVWLPGSDISGNVEIATPNEARYSVYDPSFYVDFNADGLSFEEDRKCFVVYHLYGAQTPLRMNEECVWAKETETSLGRQLAGDFRMIYEYVETMKAEGVYDNRTIIIAGNNGALELGQNPAVFIKPRHASGGFTRNSEPRTYKNLRASLVDGILPNAYQTYGYNMFDQPASDDPVLRPFVTNKNYWSQVFAENGNWIRKFIITDEAHGVENIVKTVETEPYEYKLNQWISFCGDEDEVTPDFPVTGLSFNEGNYCWTSGQDITMGFAISKPQKKAIFEMQVDGTITGYQRVNVYVNEKLLYDEVLGGPATIHVEIPKKVAPDGVFNIVLKLPDATTPMELGINDDPRVLSLRVTGCAIYSQKGYAKHLEQMAN